MRNTLIVLFFALACSHSWGQTKVYMGNFPSLSSLIYEVHPQKVIRFQNAAVKADYLFVQGKTIYFDSRKSAWDVKCSFDEKHIYKGNSTSTFDILYTLKDGKLYLGDGSFNQTCLYTLQDGKVYQGDSTSPFDILMCYELQNPGDLIIIAALIVPY